MAVTSGTVETNVYSQSHFYVNWQQVSQDIGGNSTTINWQAGLYTGTSSSHDFWYSNAVKIYSVYINGTLVSNGGTWGNITTGGSHELLSGSIPIGHNGDGAKTFDISISAWLYSNHNLSGSGNYELNTIPRYANITSFSVSKRDETSVTFNYNVDANCDWAWYSINNGSSWENLPSNNIVSSLSANTGYNFKLKVRRSDSQLITESGTSYQETYDYPKPTNANDFTIGNTTSINVYNPLGRTYTLDLISNSDGSNIGSYNGTINGWITGFNDSTSVTNQYNSIPNAKSGTYYAKVTYGGSVKTYGNKTYSIDNSDNKCNPIFDETNWSYVADLTALTNDNQKVVNNQSTITFTIESDAQAKNGASIREYQYKWGNKTNIQGSSDVVRGNGNLLEVIAIDTRGYSTQTTLDLDTNYINYFTPTTSSSNTHREDGVSAETTLNLSGQLFNETFGENGVQNELISAKYYVSTDNETFSQGYDININNFTLNNYYYSLSDYQIHANGSSGGFPVGTRYYLKVELTDKVSTLTITNIAVTDGKLAFDVFQDNNGDYHVGINGLADPNYALYIHGNSNLGNYYSTSETIIGTWIDGETLYRKMVDFGTLPNNSLKDVAHNISNIKHIHVNIGESIWCRSNQSYSEGGMHSLAHSWFDDIEVGDTNITIITNTDARSWHMLVCLEYTKTNN